eukprot:jgi/Chrpa1/25573/Chrysochromulina_OHIO_Genome00022343-RA
MPACCGGGGVLIDGGTVALSSCTITGNTFQGGEGGGGVYVRAGTVTLSSCTITGNTATFVYARGQGGFGGGVFISSWATSSVTLSSCTITGNSVALSGGGVSISGSGTVTLSSCIITGNSAYGTSLVSTSAGLTSALANAAVGRIVLASGTYNLTSELSVSRSVVLEAAVAGSVVLDAQSSSGSPRRVLNINPGSSGVVQLIGLNITRGYSENYGWTGGGGVYVSGGTVAIS